MFLLHPRGQRSYASRREVLCVQSQLHHSDRRDGPLANSQEVRSQESLHVNLPGT